MDVAILNTGAATLADTAVTVDMSWGLRNFLGFRYLEAGQGMRVVTAGTLGYADISLVQVGAIPSGNVWAEIWSMGWAEIWSMGPDGLADTLLATSNTRPASAAPGAMAPWRFTFSGIEQISLSAGQDVVVVLDGDYPVSTVNYIAVGWTAGAGYGFGTFQLYGTGFGFDDQNYPMHDHYRSAAVGPSFVIWNPPQFFVGVDYDTPDLTSIVQEYINAGVYVQGDPFAFRVHRSTLFFPPGDVRRTWANFAHATYSPVRLIIEWKERAVRVSA
jgi:hypothetical protein